jgi:hypothetical protein
MTQFEREVSFSAIDRKDPRPVPYQELRFRIEPPIQVHDPAFFNKAIWREVEPTGYKYFFGDFPYVKEVNATYSDDEATHGIATVHAGAEEAELEELLTAAFSNELNPLGKVALKFSFESKE